MLYVNYRAIKLGRKKEKILITLKILVNTYLRSGSKKKIYRRAYKAQNTVLACLLFTRVK